MPTPDHLTRTQFYILLALARRPMHAYRLITAVVDVSQGSTKIAPGNLYPMIRTLTARGLIQEAGIDTSEYSSREVMQYRITQEGLWQLKAELKRLKHAVAIGDTLGMFNDELPEDIQRMLADLERP